MTLANKLVTAEDLWRMPNGVRRERVRGELREMAPTRAEHGAINVNFALLLARHVKKNKLGAVVTGETGFRIRRDPDTVRGVDVGFVSSARIPEDGLPEKYFEGPPDLAAEVVSPNDTMNEMTEKVAEYLAAGTRMVLVIQPRPKTVTVHCPDTQPLVLRETDTLDGGDVIPGFACIVGEIFR